ncbi:hypothetical protein QP162_19000 [Sphingomonas aurantiaca]
MCSSATTALAALDAGALTPMSRLVAISRLADEDQRGRHPAIRPERVRGGIADRQQPPRRLGPQQQRAAKRRDEGCKPRNPDEDRTEPAERGRDEPAPAQRRNDCPGGEPRQRGANHDQPQCIGRAPQPTARRVIGRIATPDAVQPAPQRYEQDERGEQPDQQAGARARIEPRRELAKLGRGEPLEPRGIAGQVIDDRRPQRRRQRRAGVLGQLLAEFLRLGRADIVDLLLGLDPDQPRALDRRVDRRLALREELALRADLGGLDDAGGRGAEAR